MLKCKLLQMKDHLTNECTLSPAAGRVLESVTPAFGDMKIKIIQTFLVTVIVLSLQGCLAPATQELHRKSVRSDPIPIQYYGAWQTDSTVYISYRPLASSNPKMEVRSTQYWASVSMPKTDGHRIKMGGWKIKRSHRPMKFNVSEAKAIPIIDISTKYPPEGPRFINRERYLTYIVDSEKISLPALIFDSTDCTTLHLVGPIMVNGSYQGIWGPPRGSFRSYSTVAKNSWKYPFSILTDIVLYPFNKFIEHAYK